MQVCHSFEDLSNKKEVKQDFPTNQHCVYQHDDESPSVQQKDLVTEVQSQIQALSLNTTCDQQQMEEDSQKDSACSSTAEKTEQKVNPSKSIFVFTPHYRFIHFFSKYDYVNLRFEQTGWVQYKS